MKTRRDFVLATVPTVVVLGWISPAAAAPALRLEESDPVAAALGYKDDAGQVDSEKFPSYQFGHNCANCQLYQATGAGDLGVCAAVGGKLVAARGWCAAWNGKKA
jgi:High potential iron-sulfur protein